VVSEYVDPHSENEEDNEEVTSEVSHEDQELNSREDTPTFPSNSRIILSNFGHSHVGGEPSAQPLTVEDTEDEELENDYYETKKTRNRASNDLLEWRRMHVYKMYSTGKTLDQIADKLLVSTRTVERDLIHEQACKGDYE
jgi:hypothetical protein